MRREYICYTLHYQGSSGKGVLLFSFVNISCTDITLILRNSYHRFNRSLQLAFEYHLDWQQVKNIAQEIFTYLQKVYERNSQAYVTTSYVGENLLDRLPDYRKSPLLAPFLHTWTAFQR